MSASPCRWIRADRPCPSREIRPARTQARQFVALLVIGVATAQNLGYTLNVPSMLEANDISRWCTVWSLLEQGTYAIDECPWQYRTQDKVYRPAKLEPPGPDASPLKEFEYQIAPDVVEDAEPRRRRRKPASRRPRPTRRSEARRWRSPRRVRGVETRRGRGDGSGRVGRDRAALLLQQAAALADDDRRHSLPVPQGDRGRTRRGDRDAADARAEREEAGRGRAGQVPVTRSSGTGNRSSGRSIRITSSRSSSCSTWCRSSSISCCYARLLDRHAANDWAWFFSLVAAAWGT